MTDNFVKLRKVAKRLGLKTSLKRGTGGCNPCFCPSIGASMSDLAEFHAEDMKLRRAAQLNRVPNVAAPPKRKNDDEAWRNREFRR